MRKIFLILVIITISLTACSTEEPVPADTPTATPEVVEGAFIDFEAPIGVVAGYEISWSEFVNRVQFQRLNLINTYVQYSQMMAGVEDPELQIQFVNYLNSLEYQLDPYTLGAAVLNDISGNLMLRQQAEELGYTVTEEEIDAKLEEMFGYGVEAPVNPDETMSSAATPTPYTYEMYQQYLADYISGVNEVITFTEEDLRAIVKEQLYVEKIYAYLDENLSRTQEMIHAKHILVETEELAKDIAGQLVAGGDWDALAAEHSLDQSNKDAGGDLGWFNSRTMVEEFTKVAFQTEEGEISDPVETQFGWHLIYVLGHEEQEMSEQEYYEFRERQLEELMVYVRNVAGIEFVEGWENYIPDYPQIPDEYLLKTE